MVSAVSNAAFFSCILYKLATNTHTLKFLLRLSLSLFFFNQIINRLQPVKIIPHLHLSLMNPLREFPLLVVAAFPPNPTTSAVIIALFPPAKRAKGKQSLVPFQTIFEISI